MQLRNWLLASVIGILNAPAVFGADAAPTPALPWSAAAPCVGAAATGPCIAATRKTWAEYMQALVPLGDRMSARLSNPADAQLREELYKHLYQLISQGYFAMQYQDPRYPDFWPMFNQVFPYYFANPDDSYYQAAVEDSGVYRISGYRGTVRIADFEIGSGLMVPYGKEKLGPTLAHYDLDKDVKLGKDGWFEVVLSAQRPKNWKGDWWQLGANASFIWVRQISYDWARETDGRFAIERLDVPAAKPRPSADRIAAGMEHLPVWTETWANSMFDMLQKLRSEGLVNKVFPKDLSGTGGITTQRYIQGVYDIKRDEALILETEVPEQCRYWAFQLTDEQTDTIDPLNRHSTLNGFTARLDKDGKFRAVICAQDPGVPNWLDTVDYERGMILGRWLSCNRFPEPTLIKVKFADVREHLPADTASVSPEERDATIRARRQAAQLRRRW